MDGSQQLAIVGKRVHGSKIEYQLQHEGETQWIDYEDLTHHLPLIIRYEQQRKAKKQPKCTLSSQAPLISLDDTLDESKEPEQSLAQNNGSKGKSIKQMGFLQQKQGGLQFKVEFEDGSWRRMTNQQLRKDYPQQLLDFYEHHVRVAFQ